MKKEIQNDLKIMLEQIAFRNNILGQQCWCLILSAEKRYGNSRTFLVGQMGVWQPRGVWNYSIGKTLPRHTSIMMSIVPQNNALKIDLSNQKRIHSHCRRLRKQKSLEETKNQIAPLLIIFSGIYFLFSFYVYFISIFIDYLMHYTLLWHFPMCAHSITTVQPAVRRLSFKFSLF